MLLTVLSFLAFTLLVYGISYYKTRNVNTHTETGYFLAGRGLTGWVIAASLMLTNLSTEQMVGLNGQGYTDNMSVMGWEVGASLALIIVAFFFLPRYLKKGYATIPDFIGERYDNVTKQVVNWFFLFGYVLIFVPIVLYSGAIGLSGIFDLEGTFGITKMQGIYIVVWSIGILGIIYSLSGGLRIMAIADTINGIGLLIGGFMIPLFGLMYIGGGNPIEGLNVLVTSVPEKFNSIGSSSDPVPFATMFTGMFLVNLFYWGTNQTIIQRALAAKDLKEGQKGILYAAILKLFGPLFLILPGIIAFKIFGPGLEMSDFAYPMLVKEVLPWFLVGFFAAVLFGAILSSFNAGLNSTSTLFTLNIYKEYINPKASEKELVSKGKIAAAILAIFSMIVAPMIANAPNGLFDYLQTVNGFYNVPILTLMLIGMLNKKAPAISAKITLAIFILVYGTTQLTAMSGGFKAFMAGGMADPTVLKGVAGAIYNAMPMWFVKPLFEFSSIHYLHILAILFVICSLFMVVMGHYYPSKHEYEDSLDRHIVDTTPWKKAVPVSIAIVCCVVGLYILFSKLGIAA
ncbi:solute:sodium symporter family transporter [Candidatus Proelusimicrobium volucris]|uniref:solute:sodium symporter family transporter n=1 Tax=Candidatus Proelusimicrobium volucris TaxID=3416225 RepID=UPI003D0BCB78